MEVKLTLMHVELLLALIHWQLQAPDNGLDEEMTADYERLAAFFAMVAVDPGQFTPKVVVTSSPVPDTDTWENEGGA